MTHTETVRLVELEIVLDELRNEKLQGNCLLEIGAGAGWQAKKLSEHGYDVIAIDVGESFYAEQMIWPVLIYDGRRIPFPDNHFDIIFSSNVLEHLFDLAEFQHELRRVLKPHGIAVHVVPSASWRFWTSLAHYVFIIKTIVKIFRDRMVSVRADNNRNEVEDFALAQMQQLPMSELIRKAIFPPRHGERGTALSEIYLFRKNSWQATFERADWKIEKVFSNTLFYTGYMILGSSISISCRRKLSYVLGNSCHIFKLRIADRQQ